MLKQFALLTALLVVISALAGAPAMGQSKEEGMRLYEEGQGLYKIARSKEDLQRAAKKCEQALRIFETTKFDKGVGDAASILGVVHAKWGQYDKAAEYWEKSLGIFRKLGDLKGEGTTLNNLGLVYADWGQYSEAVKYYEKSLEIKTMLGDIRAEGATLNNLGNVYNVLGRHPKALECYEKSLAIKTKFEDKAGQGTTLMNLGSVYVHTGEYENALANFQTGLTKYEEIGIPISWPKKLMGDLYLDMGDSGRAEPLLEEAGYNSSLGRLHLIKTDYLGAKAYYEKLREYAENNRDVENLFTAYTGLGTACERLGDDAEAEKYFLKAVSPTEDLRSSVSRSEREAFFDVRINGFLRTAPHDGLARVRIRMHRPLEAFKDSEYTKSRVFAEAMSKRSEETGFDVPADVLKQDSNLTDQLAALKKKRQEAYEKSNQEVISVIEPEVKEKERELEVHIKLLQEKYPLFAATKYPQPVTLDQTALRAEEWVLSYHVTDPGLIIYLTRGKEIVKALFKPVTRDNLDNLVLKVRKPLEIVSGRDNFDEKLKSFGLGAAKKLSDLLLTEVLENLPDHIPVIVVPDGSLGMLPFEMLVLNDQGAIKTDKDLPYITGAEFFGDRNLISYCQSMTALALSRIHAKSKGTEPGLLAVADPIFQEKDDRAMVGPRTKAPTGALASLFKSLNMMSAENDGQTGGLRFSRLRLTADLAKTLAELDKKGSNVYTGFAASKANFLAKISPALNRYDKVVFATHGYFGKDLPGIMEPVLVLTLVPPGTDGYLRMTEVMGLSMNADIVALTACQTGLGRRTAGEGTMGMGRAFQYAGARSVLMSLWSVSEVASVDLVKNFFLNMKDGKSKLEALRLARKEVRKKGFDHPFFWAAFILVGEAD